MYEIILHNSWAAGATNACVDAIFRETGEFSYANTRRLGSDELFLHAPLCECLLSLFLYSQRANIRDGQAGNQHQDLSLDKKRLHHQFFLSLFSIDCVHGTARQKKNKKIRINGNHVAREYLSTEYTPYIKEALDWSSSGCYISCVDDDIYRTSNGHF